MSHAGRGSSTRSLGARLRPAPPPRPAKAIPWGPIPALCLPGGDPESLSLSGDRPPCQPALPAET